MQFYDLIENIIEEKVDVIDHGINRNKIRKYSYNGSDNLFRRKIDSEYNRLYIEELNKTGLKNKNIIFYVLNYTITIDDDFPKYILFNNNIKDIDVYCFDGTNLIGDKMSCL